MKTREPGTALVPTTEHAAPPMPLSELGEVLAGSCFFADSRQANQAIVKVLAGREIGVGPIGSMTGINIIKGKVSLSANLMAGCIKRSGAYSYTVDELTEEVCRLTFTEGGKKIGESSFSKADATKAQLASNENWKKFTRNMLFARAISNGAKWFCPDLFGGPVYTPDELGAVVDEGGDVVNVECQVVEPAKPRRTAAEIKADKAEAEAKTGSKEQAEIDRLKAEAEAKVEAATAVGNKLASEATGATREALDMLPGGPAREAKGNGKAPELATRQQCMDAVTLAKQLGLDRKKVEAILARAKVTKISELKRTDCHQLIGQLQKSLAARKPERQPGEEGDPTDTAPAKCAEGDVPFDVPDDSIPY